MTDLGLRTVKIFADGANLEAILELADQPAHRRVHDESDPDAPIRRQ